MTHLACQQELICTAVERLNWCRGYQKERDKKENPQAGSLKRGAQSYSHAPPSWKEVETKVAMSIYVTFEAEMGTHSCCYG